MKYYSWLTNHTTIMGPAKLQMNIVWVDSQQLKKKFKKTENHKYFHINIKQDNEVIIKRHEETWCRNQRHGAPCWSNIRKCYSIHCTILKWDIIWPNVSHYWIVTIPVGHRHHFFFFFFKYNWWLSRIHIFLVHRCNFCLR